MRKRIVIIILASVLFFACEEWTYPEVEDFPELLTILEESALDATGVKTELLYFDDLPILAYGHCWSQGVLPGLDDFCTRYDGRPAAGFFYDQLEELALNQIYFIRPYVTLASPYDRTLFGEAVQFATGEVVVSTSAFVQTLDDVSIRLFGFIGGLDSTTVLEQHGHLWSAQPNVESLSEGTFTNLGEFIGNGSFSSDIGGLQSLQTYYVRSYAILNGQLLLGNITEFELGGWETTTVAPPEMAGRGLPMTFVIGEKLYIGGGGRISTIFQLIDILENQRYDQIEALNDFWEYDLQKDTWRKLAPFPGRARIGAAGFSADGKGYIGWGLDKDYLVDSLFYRYDPNDDTWTAFSIPDTIPARYGPISFVFDDSEVYLGAGSTPTLGLNDFYRFSPATNEWERKADFGAGPRRNAISFSIGDYGYAGLGDSLLHSEFFFNSRPTDDFWRYDPQRDEWLLLGSFPGGDRNFMSGGSLNGKGYLSFGFQDGNLYFSDIWEYDPGANLWRQLENFPGGDRGLSIGLASSKGIYFGFGLSVNESFIPEWPNDLWEYIIID